MALFGKRKNKLSRQLALGGLDEAIGRAEDATPQAPPPSCIHNPDGGTRSHYLDRSAAITRPVCKASGSGWAYGDGGLKLCGLCPQIWAQRQESSSEGTAS